MALDAELIAWFARLGREFGPLPDASPAARRTRYEEITDLLLRIAPAAHVGVRNFAMHLAGRSIAARLYHPGGGKDGGTPGLMVFFHGGGWVVGSIHSHHQLCAQIAAQSGVAVLSVDYRLAPEHPFPAAAEDACDAVLWAATHGDELACDVRRLAVGGDSAGAHLAAVAAIAARDRGHPELALQWLIYPTIEPDDSKSSWAQFGAGPGLTADDMRWFWQQLGTATTTQDYRYAPDRADSLAGLAPAYVMTAECDLLRDEGERYATLLDQAGVAATVIRASGMAHGFARLGPVCGAAARHLDAAIAALKEGLS